METNPIVLDDSAGDVMVVVVEGEHDIYTAPTLRERLGEALARGGGVDVDLTTATIVDSSVGETVEPGVQRILDITGLVPVLPVLRGRDQAIAAARTDGARE
jgi:anti-sigma B factor antagonist